MSFDTLDAATLLKRLRTKAIGRRIEFLEETTSTSTVAMKLGRQSAEHGTVVLAERQTGGRGRRGRSWESPPGKNLYLSLLLRPQLPPSRAPEFTLVAAVAACETMLEFGCSAKVKWPNDVTIAGKKAVGILSEMSAGAEGVEFVVIGIGVDVNMSVEDFPEELRPIASSIQIATGSETDRVAVFAKLMERMEHWLERHEREGYGVVCARWMELSSTIGAQVRVDLVERELLGVAESLDATGALMVRLPSGALERIVAGDVYLV